MPEGESRRICPVCLGIRMEKLRPDRHSALLLDFCRRCGGIWFEYGEVEQLHRLQPEGFLRQVVLTSTARQMRCHACQEPMDRNADACCHCGWDNRIPCPGCGATMPQTTIAGLHLDFCRRCKGVWFDNIELSEIWNRGLSELGPKAPGSGRLAAVGEETVGSFVDIIISAPDGAVYGAQAAGEMISAAPEVAGAAVEGAGEIISAAPEVAAAAVEGAGELAGAVFEGVAAIIGGIFS